MRNGLGIYFANQAEQGDDIQECRLSRESLFDGGCQVPSVRRWMAAANAISGRPFTAAAVVGDEEERRESTTELLILSQPGWNVTKVCWEWEVRGKYARGK